MNTYDERQVAEARERLLPEIEKTRRVGDSDYWRVRQNLEGLKDMPYNATISKPLADALKALDAERLSAQREWEEAHPAEMAEADRLYRQERERMTTSLPSRIARKVINERAVLTHCPVHNTPQAMEIIMNEKDYSAIKKGMKEHITVTVQGDRDWKSFAKLSTGKWVAVMRLRDPPGRPFHYALHLPRQRQAGHLQRPFGSVMR